MKIFITALTTLLTLVIISNLFASTAKKPIAISDSYFDDDIYLDENGIPLI